VLLVLGGGGGGGGQADVLAGALAELEVETDAHAQLERAAEQALVALQHAATALVEAEAGARAMQVAQLLSPAGAPPLVLANTAAYARDLCRRDASTAVARRLRDLQVGVISRFTNAYVAAVAQAAVPTPSHTQRLRGVPPTVAAAAGRLATLVPQLGGLPSDEQTTLPVMEARARVQLDVDRTLVLVRAPLSVCALAGAGRPSAVSDSRGGRVVGCRSLSGRAWPAVRSW
jgi:hypothetical protein